MNTLVTQVFEHSRARATDDAGIFEGDQEFVLVRQLVIRVSSSGLMKRMLTRLRSNSSAIGSARL